MRRSVSGAPDEGARPQQNRVSLGRPIMTANDEVRKIFALVGQALEAVQCIEMDLVSLYLLDAIHNCKVAVREQGAAMAEAWDEKTFGKLLKPLLLSPRIPAEMKHFLEQVRVKRNYLVHDYFKQNGHRIHTADGRSAVRHELASLLSELLTCRQLINTSLGEFARELGVTNDAIEDERRRLGIPDGWAIE